MNRLTALAALFLGLTAASASAIELDAGKLGVAIPVPVASIEPLGNSNPINELIVRNLASGLLRRSADGWSFEAAAAYASSQGGLVHDFRLRSDLSFPSGKLVTVEVVRDSFEFFRARAAAELDKRSSARARLGERLPTGLTGSQPDPAIFEALANIDEIQLIERPTYYFSGERYHALRFVLKEPDSGFAQSVAMLPIVDAEIARTFAEKFGSGTLFSALGPYQIRSNRPDEGVLLERGAEYFRPGYPRSVLIEFRSFPDAVAAISALRVGAVDIIAFPTPKILEGAAADPTLEVVASPLVRSDRRWQLPQPFWSKPGDEQDQLVLDKLIIRKTLKTDDRFIESFDLSGVFLP